MIRYDTDMDIFKTAANGLGNEITHRHLRRICEIAKSIQIVVINR
jgi:hypothetical protein